MTTTPTTRTVLVALTYDHKAYLAEGMNPLRNGVVHVLGHDPIPKNEVAAIAPFTPGRTTMAAWAGSRGCELVTA